MLLRRGCIELLKGCMLLRSGCAEDRSGWLGGECFTASSTTCQNKSITVVMMKSSLYCKFRSASFAGGAHLLVVVFADFSDEVDTCFRRADGFLKRKVWKSAKTVDGAV